MIVIDPKIYHWSDNYVPYHYKDGDITGKTYAARTELRQYIQTVIDSGVPEEKIHTLMDIAYDAGKDTANQHHAEREAGASL